MSQVQQSNRVVEQLRREAALKRMPVSQAFEDIKVKATTYSSRNHHLLYFECYR